MRLSLNFIAVTTANSVSLFGKKIAKALCNIPELNDNETHSVINSSSAIHIASL
jgi:hypothetical protein